MESVQCTVFLLLYKIILYNLHIFRKCWEKIEKKHNKFIKIISYTFKSGFISWNTAQNWVRCIDRVPQKSLLIRFNFLWNIYWVLFNGSQNYGQYVFNQNHAENRCIWLAYLYCSVGWASKNENCNFPFALHKERHSHDLTNSPIDIEIVRKHTHIGH